jgi:hypothetical protein
VSNVKAIGATIQHQLAGVVGVLLIIVAVVLTLTIINTGDKNCCSETRKLLSF